MLFPSFLNGVVSVFGQAFDGDHFCVTDFTQLGDARLNGITVNVNGAGTTFGDPTSILRTR